MPMQTDFFKLSCLLGTASFVAIVSSACSKEPALIGGDLTPVEEDGGSTGGATGTGGAPEAGGSVGNPPGGAGGRGTGGGAAGNGTAGAGGGGGSDICSLPIQPGNCFAIIQSWAYDSTAKTCTQFIYGGCGGNENRFETREACMSRCNEQCAPQDANEVGTCEPFRGYKWDGKACVIVSGCSCEGADCGNLTSKEQCESDHASCGGVANCSDAKKAVTNFIDDNRECEVDADCKTVHIGCGLPEGGDCSGTAYVNNDTPKDGLEAVRTALGKCLGVSCDGPVCAIGVPPPACVAGRCDRGMFAF